MGDTMANDYPEWYTVPSRIMAIEDRLDALEAEVGKNKPPKSPEIPSTWRRVSPDSGRSAAAFYDTPEGLVCVWDAEGYQSQKIHDEAINSLYEEQKEQTEEEPKCGGHSEDHLA